VTAGGFAAEAEGEGVRAGLVDFVVLRVAGFAAAVEDVVKLCAIGAGEYAGEVFCM